MKTIYDEALEAIDEVIEDGGFLTTCGKKKEIENNFKTKTDFRKYLMAYIKVMINSQSILQDCLYYELLRVEASLYMTDAITFASAVRLRRYLNKVFKKEK